LGALCVGLPGVLFLLSRRQLRFRWIMLATVALAPIYAVLVYGSLCWCRPAHPFAETVAALQVPGVIVSGLCFYFIAVWKSSQHDVQADRPPTERIQQ
jgi:hypothetical protein